MITTDPSGRLASRACFSTRATDTAEAVLSRYARRWSLEATEATATQHLGLEGPRNGWWRRVPERRRPFKRTGPQALGNGVRMAVERTVGMIFAVYGIVLAWYLAIGKPAKDLARARRARPWDTLKRKPSYADVRGALRRELGTARSLPRRTEPGRSPESASCSPGSTLPHDRGESRAWAPTANRRFLPAATRSMDL